MKTLNQNTIAKINKGIQNIAGSQLNSVDVSELSTNCFMIVVNYDNNITKSFTGFNIAEMMQEIKEYFFDIVLNEIQ